MKPARSFLAVGAIAVLSLSAAGCANTQYVRISSQTSAQLNSIGNVQLSTTICTTTQSGGSTCGPVNANNQTVVLKIGYTIPTATTAPSSFSTVSGRALTFNQDSTYTPAKAGITVPAGSKWVGYSSNSFTYNGAAETIQVKPEFKFTQGSDGSPYTGGFPYSVTVQESDSGGLSNPSTSSGSQSVRDLGVLHTDNTAPSGNTATLRFDLKYAGSSGVGPFTVGAFSNVPSATSTPSISSLTPAANSDNNMTVRVPVPAGTATGSYVVVAYAQISGQTRAGVAHLTVTPPAPQVKQLAAGFDQTCAILHNGSVRCWGNNSSGQLGLGNGNDVGHTPNALPDSVPPVDLGQGRTALQISSGFDHTCALLDDHSVLCWGSGAGGALGQGDQSDIGDNETPGSMGPVDLGANHTAVAVAAGGSYSCAILDDHSVKCWGSGSYGELGYGNTTNVFDPSTVGPVDLGAGRTAVAIDTAANHTCVILTTGDVMCWGGNFGGKLGYGYNETVNNNIGDDETPASVGTIDLGGHTALQITGGDNDTCAVLDDHTVRCWGTGYRGINGYPGDTDYYSPPTQPVDFGPGRTALSIEGAADHTCAVLDDHSIRCWGFGDDGRLGYGSTADVGDNETPGSAGAVNLGPGRTAVAVNAGRYHSCALMDTGDVRCWGEGSFLGYGNLTSIGDNETPNTAGPVSLGD